MRSISDQASLYLRSVYKGYLDGYSICGWGVILLTNWTKLLIWKPQDSMTLSIALLAGIVASMFYATWMTGYLRTKADVQKRSTQPYRRVQMSAVLLGVLFMGTS